MTNFHLEIESSRSRKRLWRSYCAVFALVVLLGTAAFPLPIFIEHLRLERSIDRYEEKQSLLPELEAEVAYLRSQMQERLALEGRINKALPRVENLLVLRNLLLAQAQAAGVSINLLAASPPEPLDVGAENEVGFGPFGVSTIRLKGSAEMKNLLLFLGFMEATGTVYKTRSLDASFSSGDEKQASFGLEIEVYFQGNSALVSEPPDNKRGVDKGWEGEGHESQP